MPGLRPSERRIAAFLLAQPQEVANLSVAELAEKVGTSTTSVLRCTQQIGYSRFRDLRVDLARAATREDLATADRFTVSGDIDRDDSLADIVAKVAMTETLSIADTAAALDTGALARAVAAVGAAHRVDTFGVGASAIVSVDLQHKLPRADVMIADQRLRHREEGREMVGRELREHAEVAAEGAVDHHATRQAQGAQNLFEDVQR